MLCPKDFLSFSYLSDVFMTTVVLLVAGSTMMSMSLFRFWRANCFCLVMFGGKGLTLERLPVCEYCLLILMRVDK